MSSYIFFILIAFIAAFAAGLTIVEPKPRQNAYLLAGGVYLAVALLFPNDRLNFITYFLFLFLLMFCLPFSIGQKIRRAGSWAKERVSMKKSEKK